MIEKSKKSNIENFFGAYFHQDWRCEAESPEAVVAEYTRTATSENINLLAKSILLFSKMYKNDSELERRLSADFGCSYQPSGDGLSAKVWLERVANQLLESLNV